MASNKGKTELAAKHERRIAEITAKRDNAIMEAIKEFEAEIRASERERIAHVILDELAKVGDKIAAYDDAEYDPLWSNDYDAVCEMSALQAQSDGLYTALKIVEGEYDG